MATAETSERRGASWLGKPRKLRPGASIRDHEPAIKLRDPLFVRKAVLEAIAEGDDEAIATIIQAHLRVLNRTRAARQMRMSRQFIHRLIAGSLTPSLPTLGAFMRLLKTEQHGREATG